VPVEHECCEVGDDEDDEEEDEGGGVEVEAGEEEDDDEDRADRDAQRPQRVLPHAQVLLVEHVENRVRKHLHIFHTFILGC